MIKIKGHLKYALLILTLTSCGGLHEMEVKSTKSYFDGGSIEIELISGDNHIQKIFLDMSSSLDSQNEFHPKLYVDNINISFGKRENEMIERKLLNWLVKTADTNKFNDMKEKLYSGEELYINFVTVMTYFDRSCSYQSEIFNKQLETCEKYLVYKNY